MMAGRKTRSISNAEPCRTLANDDTGTQAKKCKLGSEECNLPEHMPSYPLYECNKCGKTYPTTKYLYKHQSIFKNKHESRCEKALAKQARLKENMNLQNPTDAETNSQPSDSIDEHRNQLTETSDSENMKQDIKEEDEDSDGVECLKEWNVKKDIKSDKAVDELQCLGEWNIKNNIETEKDADNVQCLAVISAPKKTEIVAIPVDMRDSRIEKLEAEVKTKDLRIEKLESDNKIMQSLVKNLQEHCELLRSLQIR